jgi:hypothetical protein
MFAYGTNALQLAAVEDISIGESPLRSVYTDRLSCEGCLVSRGPTVNLISFGHCSSAPETLRQTMATVITVASEVSLLPLKTSNYRICFPN